MGSPLMFFINEHRLGGFICESIEALLHRDDFFSVSCGEFLFSNSDLNQRNAGHSQRIPGGEFAAVI